MRCSRAATSLQLYVDNRLHPRDLPRLEDHLASCTACRQDLAHLELIGSALGSERPEPHAELLTQRILARIASYEAARALAAQRSVTRTIRSQRVALVLGVLLVVATYFAGLLGPASTALTRQANGVLQLLLSPGPNSVAWIVWAGGALSVLLLAAWLARADQSANWRRAVAQRFPQLW